MRISHRRGDGRVSQECLHGVERDSLHGQVGGEGVSQGVPPDLAQPCLMAQPVQVLPKLLAGQAPVGGIHEHVAGFPLPVEERGVHVGINGYVSLAVALRGAKLLCVLAQGVSDGDALGLPVYRRPLEPNYLSAPHAGAQGNKHHVV